MMYRLFTEESFDNKGDRNRRLAEFIAAHPETGWAIPVDPPNVLNADVTLTLNRDGGMGIDGSPR